jgi:hypothetical protein
MEIQGPGGAGGADVVRKMMEQSASSPAQTGAQQGGQEFKDVLANKANEGQGVEAQRRVGEVSQAEMQPSQRIATFLDKVNSGQHELDKIVKDLQSGKKFEMRELMTMQLQVQQLSQQMSMTTKLIGKAIENINKAINTQV